MTKSALPYASTITRGVVLVLGLALFFEQAGARHLLHLDDTPDPIMTTPTYWVSLLAPIFYLTALWSAARVFARLDRGDTFGRAMVRGLNDIGACLMLGAFSAIVVQPSLIHLFANGFTEMRGVRFDWSVENLTLIMVGLVLVGLARRGRELKKQLDEFV
jgi:hypothetical protein